MSELYNLILLFILFIVMLIYVIRRNGLMSISSLVVFCYCFTCFCSINYYTHPLYETSISAGRITTEGVLYFLIVLSLFFLPIIYVNTNFKEIKLNLGRFKIIYYTTFSSLILLWIYSLSTAEFSIDQIFADFVSIREDSYDSTTKNNLFFGLISGYLAAFQYFTIPISMFALFALKFKQKFSLLFFILAISYPVFISLTSAGRAQMVFAALEIIYTFFLIKPFLAKKIQKRFTIFFSSVICLLFAYIVYANFLRFDDTEFDVSFFLWKYAGESICNFTGLLYPDIKHYTEGVSSFGFIRRILGMSYYPNLEDLRTFVESRTGQPGYIFYTFIGNIFRDFGATITFIIASLFAYIGIKAFKNDGIINFGTFISLCFIAYIFMPGMFYFCLYSQDGTIGIILAFIFHKYLNANPDYSLTIHESEEINCDTSSSVLSI